MLLVVDGPAGDGLSLPDDCALPGRDPAVGFGDPDIPPNKCLPALKTGGFHTRQLTAAISLTNTLLLADGLSAGDWLRIGSNCDTKKKRGCKNDLFHNRSVLFYES